VTPDYDYDDCWGYGLGPTYKHWWTRALATVGVLILLLAAAILAALRRNK